MNSRSRLSDTMIYELRARGCVIERPVAVDLAVVVDSESAEWALIPREERFSVKECPECFAALRATARVCFRCKRGFDSSEAA